MFESRWSGAAGSGVDASSVVSPLTTSASSVFMAASDMQKFGRLFGSSDVMKHVYEQIAKVSPSDASVLIVGENGSGKELVAQTIHEMSACAGQPFLAMNCGALPPTLIEAELFGYEKGAFTGAYRSHAGYFERAHGGTLFLDEIGEMPPELQVRLLRVLETRNIQRIGSDETIECDIRIIAATNRDPLQAIQDMKLREDLYYRLAEFPILLPPLRARGNDVCLLADRFLKQANQRYGSNKRFADGVEQKLKAHEWPGNVRELKNCIQRAYVMSDHIVDLDTNGPFAPATAAGNSRFEFTPGVTLAEVERHCIYATLEHFNGDKRKAANALGVSLKTIYNRLNHYLATGQNGDSDYSV